MGKVYYVTTGTSLSTTSRCWNMMGDDEKLSSKWDELNGISKQEEILGTYPQEGEKYLEVMSECRTMVMEALGNNPNEFESKSTKQIEAHFDMNAWTNPEHRHRLPAEIATIAAMDTYVGGKSIFRDGDHIYFLRGKNDATAEPGEDLGNERNAYLCLAILKKIQVDGRFNQKVVIEMKEKAYDWNLTDQEAFWKGLVESNNPFYRIAQAENEIAFLLTGGFKAVSISIALLLGMRYARANASSTESELDNVTVYMLHETSKKIIHLSLKGLFRRIAFSRIDSDTSN